LALTSPAPLALWQTRRRVYGRPAGASLESGCSHYVLERRDEIGNDARMQNVNASRSNVVRLQSRSNRQNEEPLMEKNKALDAAVAQIERAFGKGSIMRMGSKGTDEQIEVIPSGSLGLDLALGIGGLPRGRIIEIYGPESSGKTTLALHAIAEAQRRGGTCAFVDAEHALDPGYARKLGVDVDNLLISQPDAGEQALEIADTLVRSGAIDVLVVDSVAALVPRAELEGEMGDSHMGLHARLMSQALRKLTGSVSRSKCMLVFLNQIRMKIGVMFGNPETTTGGNALKFYASVRLEIRRIGQIKERDEVVGNQTRVKVVKNKLAPPFRQVEFDIMYGEGISKVGELIDLGVKASVVEKSGAWFSHDSQRIGQGRENAKQFLRDHPEVADKIEHTVREQSGVVTNAMMATADESDEAEPAEAAE
jgi:recombination protein RecA